MSLRDFFEEYLGLQGERLNAIAEEPLNVLKEAILQAIPDAEVRGPERIPTGFKMEVSKCLDNGRCIQEFVCVSKRTLNDPELFANFLSIEISRLSESILEKEREPLWGFQPPPFVEDLDHDRITDDSSAETIRNYFTSLMANVELPEIRSEDPQLHTHVSVFDNSDLSASDRVVVSLGCGELHGFAMHGGTVEIARTPENLELIESLLCQSEDPQLHAHVSVDCASEGARDSLQHWYNLTRLANYRFEASANQAIAETHKLQERCRGCQNRNRDFDGHVAPEHVRDLKCAINPVYAMDGVGECADFEADEPVAQQGQGSGFNLQALINRLQSIPGVVQIQIESYKIRDEWRYELEVKKNGSRARRIYIDFSGVMERVVEKVMEDDR